MDDSPFKPPIVESVPTEGQMSVSDELRSKLRRVARAQRMVLFSILAMIAGNIALRIGLTISGMPGFIVGIVMAVGAVIFCITWVYRLSIEFNTTFGSVLYCIAMFIPCVSLIVLLVLSQQATNYLTRHNLKVGFMGIHPDKI